MAGSNAVLLASLFSLEFLSGAAGAGESKPGWPSEWEKVLQAARKEGQVVYYGTDTIETLMREFEKKYQINAVAAGPAGGGRLARNDCRLNGEPISTLRIFMSIAARRVTPYIKPRFSIPSSPL